MNIELTPNSNSIPNVDRKESISANPVVFWTLAFVAQLPLLAMYLFWIWQFEHYQYVPFLLLAIGGLAWSRIPRPVLYPVAKLPLALFTISMLILLLGSILNSPWFASVSFFMLCASFMVTHRAFYLCIPLLLLIRLPNNYDVMIIGELQALTSRLSSFVLDLLQVPHFARGNVIELADRELFVAEACSGVQSAFTIALIALLIAAWHRRPLALWPMYLAISIVWAILCNTLRVTTIAFAASRLQFDLSEGIAHEILGYSTLVLAVLLTLSTDSLLGLVFHSVGEESSDAFSPFVTLWDKLFHPEPTNSNAINGSEFQSRMGFSNRRWPIQVVSVVLLACLFPLVAYAIHSPVVVNPNGKVLFEPSKNLLDNMSGPVAFTFADSMRGGNDPQLGMNADQWKMNFGNLAGTLVFSQPYPEWHDLNMCYKAVGWQFEQGGVLQPSIAGASRRKIPYSIHTRNDGAIGHLFMTCVKGDGLIPLPPASTVLERLLEKWNKPTGIPMDTPLFSGEFAMIQIWVVAESKLSPDAAQTIANSLSQATDLFAEQMRLNAKKL